MKTRGLYLTGLPGKLSHSPLTAVNVVTVTESLTRVMVPGSFKRKGIRVIEGPKVYG